MMLTNLESRSNLFEIRSVEILTGKYERPHAVISNVDSQTCNNLYMYIDHMRKLRVPFLK